MRVNPRTEYHFNVRQTPRDTSYVPRPALEEQRVALFEGGPQGIVIATDQKIGSMAISNTFDWFVREGSDEDMQSAARLFAYTSLGTAYHLYAERSVEQVMYRKPPLPKAVNFETGEPIDLEDFTNNAIRGLDSAVAIAEAVYKATVEQHSSRRFNKRLGQSLAATGLILAAIAEKIPGTRTDKFDAQEMVYQAASLSYIEMIELSGKIGARPTIAQVTNPESPLRRYLHDYREPATKAVYTKLTNEVEELMGDESRP